MTDVKVTVSTRLITNADTYLQIAEDAVCKMGRLDQSQTSPKPDGGEGHILAYDPEQRSFKNALVAQVFACMYFEAECYIEALSKSGKEEAGKIDRSTYEVRLRSLGVTDKLILQHAEQLRKTRRELVHEKACPIAEVGEIRSAQDEANFAIDFVKRAICAVRNNRKGLK